MKAAHRDMVLQFRAILLRLLGENHLYEKHHQLPEIQCDLVDKTNEAKVIQNNYAYLWDAHFPNVKILGLKDACRVLMVSGTL